MNGYIETYRATMVIICDKLWRWCNKLWRWEYGKLSRNHGDLTRKTWKHCAIITHMSIIYMYIYMYNQHYCKNEKKNTRRSFGGISYCLLRTIWDDLLFFSNLIKPFKHMCFKHIANQYLKSDCWGVKTTSRFVLSRGFNQIETLKLGHLRFRMILVHHQ